MLDGPYQDQRTAEEDAAVYQKAVEALEKLEDVLRRLNDDDAAKHLKGYLEDFNSDLLLYMAEAREVAEPHPTDDSEHRFGHANYGLKR